MQKLMHLSTTKKYLTWFKNDWQLIKDFLEKHQLDGVELGLTLDYPLQNINPDLITGIHLNFYPMWLEFWKENKLLVEKYIGDDNDVINYYGGLNKNIIVEKYQLQYERAKTLQAEYMVFHISHIRPEDSFTWKFDYSDEEVVDATIELINLAFPHNENGPLLLFENLWWPGLTYLNKSICEKILSGVKYKNIGFVIDISHLTLTNPQIDNEKKCFDYISKVVNNLGEIKPYIYGVHLNKTLPKHYMKQNHLYKLEKYQSTTDKKLKHKILMEHVNKLDPHQPFDHPIAKEIVEVINPQFCVFETNPQTIYELNYFMKIQNKALGIIY
ncbi:MAG: xylose isomerase [Epulopiscium sp. Nele67-Bin005]|nr:MAG: xylose isomerase [Epulopiscium sp. Nele67-Bin005]